jgi:hypothetical protein
VIFVDAVLVPRKVISEKVIVTADSVEAATIESVLLERQTATTILDNVSAEDISKNPDGDAAAILERVTGISVVQDKFVYVRGLGERYSATMVNGSMIPSTEPEKKVVAFDLFPASLINQISTLKSYSPDQPGDFSGALAKVETMQFPPEFKMKYSIGVGFNMNVSMQHYLSYRGSHLDWIGFGAGARALPGDFPDKRITKRNEITGSGFTPEELQHYGSELKETCPFASRRSICASLSGLRTTRIPVIKSSSTENTKIDSRRCPTRTTSAGSELTSSIICKVSRARPVVCPMRYSPARKLSTASRPMSGRRAAVALPLPSLHMPTSWARIAVSSEPLPDEKTSNPSFRSRLMDSAVQADDPHLNKVFTREELIDLLRPLS